MIMAARLSMPRHISVLPQTIYVPAKSEGLASLSMTQYPNDAKNQLVRCRSGQDGFIIANRDADFIRKTGFAQIARIVRNSRQGMTAIVRKRHSTRRHSCRKDGDNVRERGSNNLFL